LFFLIFCARSSSHQDQSSTLDVWITDYCSKDIW
jgi:hypothetical protein